MYTAHVFFSNGASRQFDWDEYEINSSGTVMILRRRGYPDQLVPLFNVLYINLGE